MIYATIKAKNYNKETEYQIKVKSDNEFYDLEFETLLENITKMIKALKDCCELYHFEVEF